MKPNEELALILSEVIWGFDQLNVRVFSRYATHIRTNTRDYQKCVLVFIDAENSTVH